MLCTLVVVLYVTKLQGYLLFITLWGQILKKFNSMLRVRGVRVNKRSFLNLFICHCQTEQKFPFWSQNASGERGFPGFLRNKMGVEKRRRWLVPFSLEREYHDLLIVWNSEIRKIYTLLQHLFQTVPFYVIL